MIHSRAFSELSTDELYAILQLRTDVFVVEQRCAYPELDGRDREPGTRHWFLILPQDSEPLQLVAYLRTLNNGESSAIGRVVTAQEHRGQRLATRLLNAALRAPHRQPPGEWTLDGQIQLESWYARFGFVRDGEDFDEDGIAHLPMRRIEAKTAGIR